MENQPPRKTFKPGAIKTPIRRQPPPSTDQTSSNPVSTLPNTLSSSPMKPFILLPLYIYPHPRAWDILHDSITHHPNLDFQIIINPNSGPGGPPGSLPDEHYTREITKLNTYPNTLLLGYVPLTDGNRPLSSALQDIDTYAAWPQQETESSKDEPEPNLHLSGIFFDETPISPSPSTLSYLTDLTNHVRSTLPLPSTAPYTPPLTVLNPGIPPPSTFFSLADTIIIFEHNYTTYSNPPSDLGKGYPYKNVSRHDRKNSAVLIHHFTGDVVEQKFVVKKILDGEGVRGVWVGKEGYERWGDGWKEFCDVVESVSENKAGSSKIFLGGLGKNEKVNGEEAKKPATDSQGKEGKAGEGGVGGMFGTGKMKKWFK